MKVRNYIVENYKILMSCLEEELCKNCISYVRIDNEIHFLDQIIRFYDFEIDKQTIINWYLTKFIKSEDPFLSIEENLYKPIIFEKQLDFTDKDFSFNTKLNHPIRNKSIHKQESNIVKQKIKRYSR